MRVKTGFHGTEELRAMIAKRYPGQGSLLRGVRLWGLHCIAYGLLQPGDSVTRDENACRVMFADANRGGKLVSSDKTGTRKTDKPEPVANPFGDDTAFSDDSLANTYEVTEPEPATPVTGKGQVDKAVELASTLLELVNSGKGAVDAEQVRAIVREELENTDLTRTIVVEVDGREPVRMKGKTVHPYFETVSRIMMAKVHHDKTPINLFLTGPKGSGKSTLAEQVAEGLGLPFASIACNVETPVSRFIGSCNPLSGEYHSAPCIDMYENGGLFLADEFDRLDGSVATVLNGLLANSFFTRPDGKVIRKHPDFRFIATGNTYGTGADNMNVDASQLGDATLDRFFYLHVGYDWSLTASLVGLEDVETLTVDVPGDTTIEEWYAFCKKASKACDTLGAGFRHTVGPRAVIYGNALLRSVSRKLLEDGLVYRGLNESKKGQLVAAMGRV